MRPFTSRPAQSLAGWLETQLEGPHSKDPPVLLMGSGCSAAAGLPTTGKLLAALSERFKTSFRTLQDVADRIDDRNVSVWLHNHLTHASPSYAHHILAELIARQNFDVILTSNWDYLIEDSLSKVLLSRLSWKWRTAFRR